MKKTSRRKKYKFARVMLAYARNFMIVVLILAGLLWIYLSQYEKSQVSYVINQSVTSISKKEMKEATKNLLPSLDHTFQKEDEALDALYDLIHDHTSYTKDMLNTKDDVNSFILNVDKIQYGNIQLKKEEKKSLFGFEDWEILEKKIDYTALVTDDVVAIPAGWTVFANGKEVSSEYVANSEQHFKLLESFYGDWNQYGLPILLEYRIGNKIGPLDITVKDLNGKEHVYQEVDESMYLTKADEGACNMVQDFMNAFLPGYIQCLSNANHDAYGNYIALSPYLLPGGNLDIRIYNAIEGQMWANSNGDSIIDLQFNDCLSLGNNMYLSDITYELETIGLNGAVQSKHNARVLVANIDGSFKAIDIESY